VAAGHGAAPAGCPSGDQLLPARVVQALGEAQDVGGRIAHNGVSPVDDHGRAIAEAGVSAVQVAVHEAVRHPACLDRRYPGVHVGEQRGDVGHLLAGRGPPRGQPVVDPPAEERAAPVGYAGRHERVHGAERGDLDAVVDRRDRVPFGRSGGPAVLAGRVPHKDATLLAGGDERRRRPGHGLTEPAQHRGLVPEEPRDLLEPGPPRPAGRRPRRALVEAPDRGQVPGADLGGGDTGPAGTRERRRRPREAAGRTARFRVRRAERVRRKVDTRHRREPVGRVAVELGQERDGAAGRLGTLGGQQPQHRDRDAEAGPGLGDHPGHLLPPRLGQAERRQRAERGTRPVDEHEPHRPVHDAGQ
jgi:hypothetical protein